MSALIVTTPQAAERQDREAFARQHTDPEYRGVLAPLYRTWHGYNDRHFGVRLLVPHLGIGPTPPRRLSQCRPNTDYGGQIDITLGDRVVFPRNRRLVRNPWPAPGTMRFVDDLLLGETVKQFVLEVHGQTEEGYGHYGPLFAAEAMRIGPEIGLPKVDVIARRRGPLGRGEPVAAFWPWLFRPEGYYGGDVDLTRLPGGHPRTPSVRPQSVVPGVFGYLLHLAQTGQTARLVDVLGRQVDFETEARTPAVAAFERGPRDASGMPLPVPEINPDWLGWYGSTPRVMAEGILAMRTFGVMPILADALEEGGCDDQLILAHCRAQSDHTARCWVLNALLASSPP